MTEILPLSFLQVCCALWDLMTPPKGPQPSLPESLPVRDPVTNYEKIKRIGEGTYGVVCEFCTLPPALFFPHQCPVNITRRRQTPIAMPRYKMGMSALLDCLGCSNCTQCTCSEMADALHLGVALGRMLERMRVLLSLWDLTITYTCKCCL